MKYEIKAPTRVDLSGGTLDLWPIAPLVGGGRTINLAISLHAIVAVEEESAAAFRLDIASADGATASFSPGNFDKGKGNLKFPSFVVTTFLSHQENLPKKRIRFSLSTEAPLRSGLGGSSALCVALTTALYKSCDPTFFEKTDWQWKLMEFCRDLEAAYLWTPTGTQDYLPALFGGLNSFHYQIGDIERETYPEKTYDELRKRMLVLFSGEMHHSGSTNWELYRTLLEGNEELLKGFSSIREVSEKIHTLLGAKSVDWDAVGKLLSEEWQVRKNVFRVVTPRLDDIVKIALKEGALGIKVCGAAGGGSLLCLVDPDKLSRVKGSMEKAGVEVLDCTPTLHHVA